MAGVFLAGMAVRGAIGDGSEAPSVTRPHASSGPGPTREVAGAPAGFARTRAGAQAAAVAYTATLSQRLLYAEPEAAEAALRAVAATASEETLVSEALTAVRQVREPLAAGSGPTWWVVEPLATKVGAYTEDRARVSVWLVRVLSHAGVVVPQSSWSTETVELVWERGDWRLWSDDASPGPTPVLDGSDLPASAAELDADLAGFELLGAAAAPS